VTVPHLTPDEALQRYRDGKARPLNDLEEMCYVGASPYAKIYEHLAAPGAYEYYLFQTIEGVLVIECNAPDVASQSVALAPWSVV